MDVEETLYYIWQSGGIAIINTTSEFNEMWVLMGACFTKEEAIRLREEILDKYYSKFKE